MSLAASLLFHGSCRSIRPRQQIDRGSGGGTTEPHLAAINQVRHRS
jgi:hypothetical protein